MTPRGTAGNAAEPGRALLFNDRSYEPIQYDE
jgi:hypothetical protein